MVLYFMLLGMHWLVIKHGLYFYCLVTSLLNAYKYRAVTAANLFPTEN